MSHHTEEKRFFLTDNLAKVSIVETESRDLFGSIFKDFETFLWTIWSEKSDFDFIIEKNNSHLFSFETPRGTNGAGGNKKTLDE